MATKLKETDEEQTGEGESSEPDASSRISEPGSADALAGETSLVVANESAEGTALTELDPPLDEVPAQLGASRYVHAAFFAAAILVAYVSGKLLTLIWNSLAELPTAVRAVPFLLSYGETERETFGLVAGALIGVITVIQTYRKEHIRRWADDVAGELAKVAWPNRETVTNGTIVVVIATVIATVYVSLLDKFWSFVTNLVYGA